MKTMTMVRLGLALAIGLVSAPAFADPAGTGYVGGQIARTTYDEDGYDEVSPLTLVARGGYYFSPYFSVEGRLGFGLTEDGMPVWTNIGIVDVDIQIDSLAGAYAVGHLPITNEAQLYALAGFSRVVVSGEAFGLEIETDDSGFSWGFGAEYNVTPRVGINVEYMHYVSSRLWDVTAISAGVNFKF